MTQPAILVRGLRRAYGGNEVLKGVDLSVEPGTVHALLGPNGSGKTTMVNILSTLIRPDSGEVRIAGHDVLAHPQRVRPLIGVTGQFSAVDSLLTGRENLKLMGDLNHLSAAAASKRIDELLEMFELTEAAGRIPATYSGGMRRRLDLAMTLVAAPQVIFLDEPTTGLDPRGRRDLWGLVQDLVRNGTTVFLTTQYLEEADRLADCVSVLDDGRIIAEGTPAELKRLLPGGHLKLRFAELIELEAAREAIPGSMDDVAELSLRVPWDGSLQVVGESVSSLERHGIAVIDLALETPDLDDVFLALTGRSGASVEATSTLQAQGDRP